MKILATCLLNIIQFRLFSHLYFHPRARAPTAAHSTCNVHEYYTSRGEYHGWPNNHCLHCLFCMEEPMATQLAQDQARQSMSAGQGYLAATPILYIDGYFYCMYYQRV